MPLEHTDIQNAFCNEWCCITSNTQEQLTCSSKEVLLSWAKAGKSERAVTLARWSAVFQ